MMKRITLKDGPLDGKTYDVPHDTDHITADGGSYRLTAKTVKWEPSVGKQGATATATMIDETKAA